MLESHTLALPIMLDAGALQDWESCPGNLSSAPGKDDGHACHQNRVLHVVVGHVCVHARYIRRTLRQRGLWLAEHIILC